MFENQDRKLASEFELIEELELNHRNEIFEARDTAALQVRAPLGLTPGNASSPAGHAQAGETCSLTGESVTATFERPVAVGDVYRLTFDGERLRLPPAFALCRECRMTTADRFEAVFKTFEALPINS